LAERPSSGRAGLLLVLWTPIIVVWSWWTQHFLLGGAVGWRWLVPGALAMTVGLAGLRAFAAVRLFSAISSNYAGYGPLGIVFMLLTWLVALSAVMLGGPVLGAALHERRMQAAASRTPAEGTDLLVILRERGALVRPAPRARDHGPAEGSGDE
jgi:membrane protein